MVIIPDPPTVNDLATSDTTPVLTGTYDDRADLRVTVNGITYVLGSDPELQDAGNNQWELTIPPEHELAEGTYPVTATNAAGSDTGTLIIDLSDPEITTLRVRFTARVSSNVVEVRFGDQIIIPRNNTYSVDLAVPATTTSIPVILTNEDGGIERTFIRIGQDGGAIE